MAESLAAASPLTMSQLVQEIDRLFNRMTFRYERTWQCRTQSWERRLHAAMQTWRLLEDYRSFVRTESPTHSGNYESLLREVYRYCDYMASYLFTPPANLSALKEVVGDDKRFMETLSSRIHFPDLDNAQDLKTTDEPRALAIRHMNALLDAFALSRFDVFLSHTGEDKPIVRQLKQHLVDVPLRVWLDEDELRPGAPWQPLLEAAIRRSASVVVAIGTSSEGAWQKEEMQAALDLAVHDGRPVIPVLLPGAPEKPKLQMFLGGRTWVDLRQGITPEGIGKLVWGITGQK